MALPMRSVQALPYPPSEWKLASMAGRLVELSGAEDGAALTMAFGLVREAQLLEEPVAWVSLLHHSFFPPDAAAGGVDLNALAVVRVEHQKALARAADHLARSGAFGLIVLDVMEGVVSMAVQSRLLGLARKHDIAMVFLTRKTEHRPSLGSLISLRGQATRKRSGLNAFTCRLCIVKDKRRAPGWNHTEVCGGPAGLH
jgi:recombination protein RecA